MTELEQAMVMIIDVFNRYATSEDKKQTLNKGEMKTLIQKELPAMIDGAKDKNAFDKIMKDLDENRDNEVDFNEFIVMVAVLTTLGHNACEKNPAKK